MQRRSRAVKIAAKGKAPRRTRKRTKRKPTQKSTVDKGDIVKLPNVEVGAERVELERTITSDIPYEIRYIDSMGLVESPRPSGKRKINYYGGLEWNFDGEAYDAIVASVEKVMDNNGINADALFQTSDSTVDSGPIRIETLNIQDPPTKLEIFEDIIAEDVDIEDVKSIGGTETPTRVRFSVIRGSKHFPIAGAVMQRPPKMRIGKVVRDANLAPVIDIHKVLARIDLDRLAASRGQATRSNGLYSKKEIQKFAADLHITLGSSRTEKGDYIDAILEVNAKYISSQ